ncbi:MAG: hypothetical protein QM768_23280 [Agriterribacter sp.]
MSLRKALRCFISSCFIFIAIVVHAQSGGILKPGFNAKECDEMLQLNFAFLDTTKNNRFENFAHGFRFLYRSEQIGLDNQWDLWMRDDSVVTIVLRGTTANPKSILADFYAAMFSAQSSITIPEKDTITYKLANDPKAAVHAGFLTAFAFLSRDMQPKIDSLYKIGYHNFLVTGHSQGGSLCYFVSSWLLHLKAADVYPGIVVKTYASAPTKVGNMYFAYDYDNLTRSEWTFSIINSADAVPELPFTVQQVEGDINEPNPIMALYKRIDALPFFKRIILKCAFNKMRNGAKKSSKAYQKYLGGYSEKFIKDMLPGLELPKAVNTTYFIRPGVPIILVPNNSYYKRFEVNDGPYYHHGILPYRFLLREYYEGLPEIKQ